MVKIKETIHKNLEKLPLGCINLTFRLDTKRNTPSEKIYSSKHYTNDLSVEVFYKPISRIGETNKTI